MKVTLATRFKIVGAEVVGFGAFLLIELVLSLRQAQNPSLFLTFSYDYALIGAILIAVGFEILSLIKHLPAGKTEKTG